MTKKLNPGTQNFPPLSSTIGEELANEAAKDRLPSFACADIPGRAGFLKEYKGAFFAPAQAGLELWKYYHSQPDANPNASLYDIKEHFQGRDEKGRMKASSMDEPYMALLQAFREALGELEKQIVPKIYEHGFLR